MTPAASGVLNPSHWGTKSEVANEWAGCLHKPYRLSGPISFKMKDEIRNCQQLVRVAA